MSTASVGHLPAAHAPAQLPDGWRLARLSDVCELNPRRPNLSGRADDAPTTFVPMQAVGEREGAIVAAELRPFREVANGYTYFAEGDVLFAKITPCMQNGKHAIARGLTDGIGFGSTEFHVIRPGPDIMAEWVWHYVRQPRVLADATRYFSGAVGQQRVPDAFLARLRIPLPPPAEQRRIVAALSEKLAAVEKARAAAEAGLVGAKRLVPAHTRDVFTANKWPYRKLGDVCRLVNGDAYKESDWSQEGTPIVRIQNLNDATKPFNYWSGVLDDRVRIDTGDVLLGWSGTPGTSFGAHLWTRGPAVLNQHIFRVDLDERVIRKEWAVVVINEQLNTMIASAHGAVGLRHVTKGEVESLRIPVPPLVEQERLARCLAETRTLAEVVQKAFTNSVVLLGDLRASLLRRAFHGGL